MTPQGSKCGVYYFNITTVISTLCISLVVKNYYLSMLGMNDIKYVFVVYVPVQNHKSVNTLGFLLQFSVPFSAHPSVLSQSSDELPSKPP
jgi:hypothetical protein